MRTTAMLISAVALAAASVLAQEAAKVQKVDVTGVWLMTVESPQGSMQVTATYKQDGETLTGTHSSEMGDAPLKGTVKGADISYTLTIDMQGQQFTIVHTGKVDGDSMSGSADLGGMGTINWTAKRKK